MEILKNHVAIIEYTIRLEDGSYVKGEDGPVSLNFIAGYGQLLPALEQRLIGLKEGEETDFVIPAREAFGAYDPSKVQTKSLIKFPDSSQLSKGKWVVARDSQTQAQYTYYVKDKTDELVVLDFNHPLAGKDLHYDVKIVKVRPALQEELEHVRPCEFTQDSSAVSSLNPH